MLHTLLPITLVNCSILPKHFSVTVSFVKHVAAAVAIPTFPFELTMPMLFVVVVLPGVLVADWICLFFFPAAFSMLHSLLESTNIGGPRFPLVQALPFWYSVKVLARERVLVGKVICSFPILKTSGPLTLVFVAVVPLVDAISPSFVVPPFP